MSLPSVNFFGFKISVFTKEELLKTIEYSIFNNESMVYYGYSLAALIYIKKYPLYYKTTNNFDVMVTDGSVFYMFAKFFGFNLKTNISIPELTLMTLDLANKNCYSLMLIGGIKKVNEKAYNNLKIKYPNICYREGLDGYYKSEEKERVFLHIKKNKPNIILLGMPTPKKQLMAAEIKEKLNTNIIIPFGGMIDVLAGKEKLTPRWLKKIGLASIYRHIQNPKRLPELFIIYILTLKIFCICFVLKYLLHRKEINIPNLIL